MIRVQAPLALLVVVGACAKAENGAPSAAPATSASAAPAPVASKPGEKEPAVPDAAPAPVEAPAWPPKSPTPVTSDWCVGTVVSALDDESCFVLPDRPTRALLIYLHGIVPPERDSFQKTNYETVVAVSARRAGVAALLPRGKQGLAPKGQERWWGWPTGESGYQKYTAALATRLLEKKGKLEQATGVSFDRVYLAGSSSGAYFVAALAIRGAFPADGFGAMSGGAGHATAEQLSKLERRPFYIGFGTHDTVGPAAKSLGKLFEHAGWPVRIAEHPVGHGAKEVYLDEAFEFWGVTSKK